MSTKQARGIHNCTCSVCQTGSDAEISQYHQQINLLLSRLNEAQRRWYVGVLNRTPGGPSIRLLVAITGMSSNTILRGRQEIANQLADVPTGRQRQPGGGKPKAEKKTQPLKR